MTLQTHFEKIKEKYPTPDEYLTELLYNYNFDDDDNNPYSDKNIELIHNRIESLQKYMKETNKTLHQLETPEFAIFAAIQQLRHPNLVEALWKMKPNKLIYNDINIFSKMPSICNPETGEIYLIPAIKDVMKWTYINVKYLKYAGQPYLSKETKFEFLDKYAEIMGIEYETKSYD
jgi:hypothetical protein